MLNANGADHGPLPIGAGGVLEMVGVIPPTSNATAGPAWFF